MRLNTAATKAAFSSLVYRPFSDPDLEPKGSQAGLRERLTCAEPVGAVDCLHPHGGHPRIFMQHLGGEIARRLGHGCFKAWFGTTGCICDSNHRHGESPCFDGLISSRSVIIAKRHQ